MTQNKSAFSHPAAPDSLSALRAAPRSESRAVEGSELPAQPLPTPAQQKALTNAAARPEGYICPTLGVHSGAQGMLLSALYRRGWAMDHPDRKGVPVITDAGRAAINRATS